MKKYFFGLVFTFFILVTLQCFIVSVAFGQNGEAKKPYLMPDMSGYSGEDILNEIEIEMEALYGSDAGHSYFRDYIEKYGKIRYDWLEYDLARDSELYKKPFLLAPVLYFPNDTSDLSAIPEIQDAMNPIGNINSYFPSIYDHRELPVWGKDAYGRWYTDWGVKEAYWFKNGWSGYRFNGKFWNNDNDEREVIGFDDAYAKLDAESKGRFDSSDFRGVDMIDILTKNMLNELIQLGADTYWAGKKGYELDLRKDTVQNERSEATIHYKGEAPPGGWVDKILIMIPPTYISWGYGIRFSADRANPNIVYSLEIPIAPINMLPNDISARLISGSESVVPGERVNVVVGAASNLSEAVLVPFKWTVEGLGEDYVVTYDGSEDIEDGYVTIEPEEEAEFSVSFIMPKDPVDITFEMNCEDGTGKRVLEEDDYDNNIVNHKIVPKNVPNNKADLEYWVLTRKVAFPLSFSATVTKPSGTSWYGGSEGSLSVANGSPDIYRDFEAVKETDKITGEGSTVTRKPSITAKLDRKDFGDDPLGKNYAENYSFFEEEASVTSSGSISRKYIWYCSPRKGCDGHFGTASDSFGPPSYEKTYSVNVYNGIEELFYKKNFIKKAKKIERPPGNTHTSVFELAWKGTAYPFEVVRYMCHWDKGGREIGWEPVPGQYERTFIGQSEGTLTWNALLPMESKNAYGAKGISGSDRQNAYERKNGKDNYKNAVFATDKLFQGRDYPIKSGYYFNPVGTYTCTIVTKQYKETNEPTKEHEELIEKVKASFRYSSDLQYIDANRNKYTMNKNNRISEDNPKGILKINDKTTMTAVPVKTTIARTGDIDELFQEVMEGYEKSETAASFNSYKYKERTDKLIYLVTETTVVTFKISVDGRLYSHVNMPNGTYGIRVWAESFKFESIDDDYSPPFNDLTIPISDLLDTITVTVEGSMYDDR